MQNLKINHEHELSVHVKSYHKFSNLQHQSVQSREKGPDPIWIA